MFRDSVLVLLGISIVLITEAAFVLWNTARFAWRAMGKRQMLMLIKAYWLGVAAGLLAIVLVVVLITAAIWYGLTL